MRKRWDEAIVRWRGFHYVEPDAERVAVYRKAVDAGNASAKADSSYAFMIFFTACAQFNSVSVTMF